LKLVEFDDEHKVVWSWNEAYGGTENQVIVFNKKVFILIELL